MYFLENRPAKTEVITINATDPEGLQVSYRLVGGSGLGLFKIDPKNGVIRTTAELDFEAGAFYWLTVRATDSITKPRFSNLHVFIRVLNRNDRVPMFAQPIYFTSIEENSAENKVVIKLEASDSESSSETSNNIAAISAIKYSIVKGNPQSNFVIDENTGMRAYSRTKVFLHFFKIKCI